MVAKDALVMEEGIGEDLPFTIFGWRDGYLIIVAQLEPSLMKMDYSDRLQRVSFCCNLFRMGWQVDAITFMAEGYCSTNPDKTQGKPLDLLYAENEKAVSECLTFTHCDEEGISLVMVSFTIGLGRVIHWGEATHQRQPDGLRDAQFPYAISMALSQPVRQKPEDEDDFFNTLTEGLISRGFNVESFE